MRASIVTDLGFGDSGKGITVDWLCSAQPDSSLVLRFGGGHQVGHTVRVGAATHVFSNFGSGSLRGVPSWYGPETVVFPPAIALEAQALRDYEPKLFLHPLAMVATPWDIAWNRANESLNGHGSCGVGFGATIERNAAGIRLYAKDLFFPWILGEKLRGIEVWYRALAQAGGNERLKAAFEYESADLDSAAFIEKCRKSIESFNLAQLEDVSAGVSHLILEGHQGILLDKDHGIYPHVTWSSSGSRGALELLSGQVAVALEGIDLYYVTRCYQTRHGTGPMSSEGKVTLVNHQAESNVENRFQGTLRTASLDPDLLEYSLVSDQCELARFSAALPVPRRNLVITCLDQLPEFDADALIFRLGQKPHGRFHSVYGSYSPDSAGFHKLRPY